ncbi:hypothetical protein KA005_10020, partial [bacterium]|nr:hypothetical protein [bacterium]
IQQRVSGGITGTQFQFQGEEIFSSGYSVINGQESILNLIKAVEEQIKEFGDEIAVIEQRILDTAVELESEKYMVDGLTQERDIARSAYTALANQLEEIQITQAQDENSVKIAASAVIPQKPQKPSVPINTILAAIAGFMLSTIWILFSDWWNQEVE